jgi:drug/metabolite transporter (DMT)-like permease
MLTYAAAMAAMLRRNHVDFVMNMHLLRRYRPSALAAWSLTTPIFGVLVSAVIAGDALTATLLFSTLMVAAGIGLTTRR